ncbi:MAG: Crp/Fnr family transcriptional regulator [Gemmatimonadota bacterium]
MIDIELLGGIPAVAGLPQAVRIDIARVAREVHYDPGHRIFTLFRPPQEIIFVVDGLAKLSGVAMNGIERIIYVFRPGSIIGSRVLLDESPESSYEVVAMRKMRGVAISKPDFLDVGRRYPDLLVAVASEFSRRLDHMTHRVLAAMSVEVPVRLSQLLLDFAGHDDEGEGFIPLAYSLTHETMAQIIGASRPHTSTVLRDLERLGAVRRRSPKGLLIQPDRLREIVTEEAL